MADTKKNALSNQEVLNGLLDKGKKTVESFRKSSLFSMGFPKVFLVCCKHVKPFSTVSTSPTTTTEINMQLQQQWLSEVSKNEV